MKNDDFSRLFPKSSQNARVDAISTKKRGQIGVSAGGILEQNKGFCPRRNSVSDGDFIRGRELPFRPHLPAHIPRMTLVAGNSLKLYKVVVVVQSDSR